MITRLLKLFLKKPLLLDALMLCPLLPLFSHYIVSIREEDTLWERLHTLSYWVAFAFSLGCSLLLVAYIREVNARCNQRYGFGSDILQRVSRQLFWGLLLPLGMVLLAVLAYFACFNELAMMGSYFQNELPIAALGLVVANALYTGLDMMAYFHDRDADRRAADRLLEGLSPSTEQQPMLLCESVLRGHETLMELERIDLVRRDRHKSYGYVWAEKYLLKMPLEDLKQHLARAGYFWVNQWYAVPRQSVVGWGRIGAAQGADEKGGLWGLKLKQEIVVHNAPHTHTVRDGEGRHLWLEVSKRQRASARKWCMGMDS